MATQDIAIVAAKRTAIGNFLGSLSSTPSSRLGEVVIKQVISDTGIDPKEVSEVILGQILTANAGMNPARQASLGAGIPKETAAWMVNHVCGSGLKSIALGALSIQNGFGNIIVAGGQENMSLSPHAMMMRAGQKMGNTEFVDLMIKDGLTDVFNNYHMGITAENLAEKFNISRNEQDEFSLQSQNKAEKAQKDGKFVNEIVPVKIMVKKDEVEFKNDEFIKHGALLDDLSKIRPAFKKDGTVTAGNASGINDGAAVVMLMPLNEAQKRGLKVLGVIKSIGQGGVEPELMGLGPIPASKMALERAGWNANDLDLIEANEAFAVQAICVNRQMGWDTSKVNVLGGAVALGHPIGASGARVLVTLLHEMNRRNAKKGLATLCIGGGMGIAMCIEAA